MDTPGGPSRQRRRQGAGAGAGLHALVTSCASTEMATMEPRYTKLDCRSCHRLQVRGAQVHEAGLQVLDVGCRDSHVHY